ncbi:ABC transporter substrate-binding protein [Ferrovibrio sp.]|uniref:ABC transporter substrate-binding protein n=1 Tax=Ferrovibrio sp. TaxID=1917215 RepID=UPI003D2E7A4F
MRIVWTMAVACLTSMGMVLPAVAQQPVRMAVIEPLSGPVAGTGKPWVDHLLATVDELNQRGGVLGGRKIDVLALDNAGNVERTNEHLKRIVDEGIQYIVLGIGSNHALATVAFIERHNKRNPDKPLLFFNTSGGALALTNENCSFWHYRWGVGADMNAAVLVNAMSQDPTVKRIFQIDQAYALGQSFNEVAARLMKERLPNASVVGSELIQPFGKVQDFTPYIAKMKELNVDTVVTSSADVDFLRFYRAAVSAGMNFKIYATYGNIPAHMAALSPEDVKRIPIYSVTDYADANPGPEMQRVYKAYMDRFKGTFYGERHVWMLEMFRQALEMAGRDDARLVARNLETIQLDTPQGRLTMRKDDHQFTFPLAIVELTGDVPNKFMVEGRTTGLGQRAKAILKPMDAMMSTTCKMERPS